MTELLKDTLHLLVAVAVNTGSLSEFSEYASKILFAARDDLLSDLLWPDVLLESGSSDFAEIRKTVGNR